MNIIQDFIPVGRNNRPGIKMTPKYITIHDTGNPSAGADAPMHAKYIKSDAAANRPASWHFTVDDKIAVQHLPLDEVGWHAGDGNGPGNMTSIGIEICENVDGDRAKAEANAADLVAELLKQFKLSIDAVVQHNKWSGKNCPHILRARSGGWLGYIEQIHDNLYPLKTEDANKVIGFLQAAYNATADTEARAEFNRLANELRKASGQSVQ